MSLPRKTTFTTSPKVQVSWGELVDRITILEIKEERLESNEAAANVRRERVELERIADEVLSALPDVAMLKQQLKTVNEALWDIENKIRAKEASKCFDHEFIGLARSVYINNDKRGALKVQINTLVGSELTEEKQYTNYKLLRCECQS